MSESKLAIVVSGMIAGDPYQGGATWAVLQYVLGLMRLGHHVQFIEPIQPQSLQPNGVSLASSANARYFREITREFGIERNSALLLNGTQETVGRSYEALCAATRQCDILINISGMLNDAQLIEHIPTRVYLDLDPGFIQLWHAVEGIDMRFAGHTHFVTIGLDIGSAHCAVPICDISWLTTLQPIVMSRWPVAQSIDHDALTTIGNWRGYGSIEHQGVFYGQKAHSLRQFLPLPKLTDQRFLLALAIDVGEKKDLLALAENGWQLADPSEVAGTPATYQRFIQGSKAEFGIAKSGYVLSRCGWFSDRSACYLASGRPVLAQETGFGRHLPSGEGLLSFESIDDALRGIDALNSNYKRHAAAAREIAEQHFDSDKVLTELLRKIGASA